MAENLNDYFMFTRVDISSLPGHDATFLEGKSDYLGQFTVTTEVQCSGQWLCSSMWSSCLCPQLTLSCHCRI